ncbi:MAG: hypothetical protein R2764_14080 [Bacteroidales bacterium]
MQKQPGKYSQDQVGQIDWQSLYNQNTKPTNTGFGYTLPIDSAYNDENFTTLPIILYKATITTDGMGCYQPLIMKLMTTLIGQEGLI